MKFITTVAVSTFLLLTFNQTHSMGIFKWIPFISYFSKTEKKLSLPEFSSHSKDYYKKRDRALYALYVETGLNNKVEPIVKDNYSLNELQKEKDTIYTGFKNWCTEKYNLKNFYPRKIHFIEKDHDRLCPASSIEFEDNFYCYYSNLRNTIPNKKSRIKHLKDNIEIATKLLEKMPKEQPLTSEQRLIQSAQAGLAIDTFVRTNNIPDKRTQKNGFTVFDIEDFAEVIINSDTLKDVDAKNKVAFFKNYLETCITVVPEKRKQHFEKIIKNTLFLNPSWKFNTSDALK